MIDSLSKKIVAKLFDDEGEDAVREWYLYAVIRLIETAVSVITFTMIGAMLGKLVHTVLFLTAFIVLRMRTGGFHCDKFWKCYTLSCLIILGIIYIESIISSFSMLIYIMLIPAATMIFIFGTIDPPNMNMTNEEVNASKKLARIICLIELITVIILEILNAERSYINFLSLAIILCSVLLVLQKYKKHLRL